MTIPRKIAYAIILTIVGGVASYLSYEILPFPFNHSICAALGACVGVLIAYIICKVDGPRKS